MFRTLQPQSVYQPISIYQLIASFLSHFVHLCDYPDLAIYDDHNWDEDDDRIQMGRGGRQRRWPINRWQWVKLLLAAGTSSALLTGTKWDKCSCHCHCPAISAIAIAIAILAIPHLSDLTCSAY